MDGFFVEDEELLRYTNTWNKVSNSMQKEFYSEPIYNKKILKTEIKSSSYDTTDFHDKEMPKVGSNHTFSQ